MLGAMPVTVLLPVLVSVAANAAEVVCAVVFGKVSTEVNATELGAAMPVPRRVDTCGEPADLSATDSVAEKPETTDGVKVM